jgi:hypothetical protein
MTTYESTKRYLNEQWLPKDREPSLFQQLPVFIAAGTAAERAFTFPEPLLRPFSTLTSSLRPTDPSVASGVGWTASDVLKSRLQSGKEGTRAIPLIRKIIREEGWLGLQRGYLISTLIFIPNVSFSSSLLSNEALY